MRYGIFGGSFDPIHFGHLLLAETCRHKAHLDRVIFVPSGLSPHKSKKNQTPSNMRAEMIELAIAGAEELTLSRYEIEKNEISYTIETIRHFHQTLLDVELFLLVGADMYFDIPNWFCASEILNLVTPIGVYRPGGAPPHVEVFREIVSHERCEQFRRYIFSMPQIGISSTMIRESIAQEESIRFLTPRAVEAYIKSHQLYTLPAATTALL